MHRPDRQPVGFHSPLLSGHFQPAQKENNLTAKRLQSRNTNILAFFTNCLNNKQPLPLGNSTPDRGFRDNTARQGINANLFLNKFLCIQVLCKCRQHGDQRCFSGLGMRYSGQCAVGSCASLSSSHTQWILRIQRHASGASTHQPSVHWQFPQFWCKVGQFQGFNQKVGFVGKTRFLWWSHYFT